MNDGRSDRDISSDPDNSNEEVIVIQRREEIPAFTNEEEEATFWDTHTLAPHFFTRKGPRPGSLLESYLARRNGNRSQLGAP